MGMPIHPEAATTSPIADAPAVARAILRGRVDPSLIRDELLCEVFGATASHMPDQPCMFAGDQTFTYADVDQKATAMARGLAACGVELEELEDGLIVHGRGRPPLGGGHCR